MLITINSVDSNALQRIGSMQFPSFPVQFSAAALTGRARFVPSSGDAEGLVGQSFQVEIEQGRVTDLRRVGVEAEPKVIALAEPGSFQVCGIVRAVVPLGETDGSVLVSVVAGEAVFTLCQDDLRGMALSQGERVTFTAHEVSLWDEAI